MIIKQVQFRRTLFFSCAFVVIMSASEIKQIHIHIKPKYLFIENMGCTHFVDKL